MIKQMMAHVSIYSLVWENIHNIIRLKKSEKNCIFYNKKNIHVLTKLGRNLPKC